MIEILQARNRQVTIRLLVVLALFALVGSTLAMLARKAAAQRQLLALHTTIVANLPLIQAETMSLMHQLTAFRQALPADIATRSPELLLATRLDQIKSRLQPGEMNVTPTEVKDGIQTIGFTLKVPLDRYASLVNGMGQLQTELVPFVDFKEFAMSATAADSSIVVQGSVILPPYTGGTP